MEIDPDNPSIAYVADSGGNKLVRVDLTTGGHEPLPTFLRCRTHFPSGLLVMERGPTSDVLQREPTAGYVLNRISVCPRAASVVMANPTTGEISPFINSRTTAMDIAWRSHGERPQFFVLEFSANMTASPAAPGRLIEYDTENGGSASDGLITPSVWR